MDIRWATRLKNFSCKKLDSGCPIKYVMDYKPIGRRKRSM